MKLFEFGVSLFMAHVVCRYEDWSVHLIVHVQLFKQTCMITSFSCVNFSYDISSSHTRSCFLFFCPCCLSYRLAGHYVFSLFICLFVHSYIYARLAVDFQLFTLCITSFLSILNLYVVPVSIPVNLMGLILVQGKHHSWQLYHSCFFSIKYCAVIQLGSVLVRVVWDGYNNMQNLCDVAQNWHARHY